MPVDDDHPGDHWSDLKFIYLALALAVVTALEVALSYMVDDLGPGVPAGAAAS